MFKIENLQELLKPYISESENVIKYETTRLTEAGENYASLMLSLDVIISKRNGQEEILHLVAKKLPENDAIIKLFQVETTFRTELNLYKIIIPTLRAFLKEEGVEVDFNIVPKFFGGRFSLNETSTVPDEDAIILLENLKFLNFEIVDRTLGFNLEESKLILKDLAVFHAVPIALRLKKPDIYNSKLHENLTRFDMGKNVNPEFGKRIVNNILNVCKLNKVYDEHSSKIDSLLNVLTEGVDFFKQDANDKFNPFYSITHNDLWINNTMLKFENNKPLQNKLVDFQLTCEDLVSNDVIFFIYSSVQNAVIENCFDDLIDVYFNTFIETLNKLNCDISEFTWEVFNNILSAVVKKQLIHTLIMLQTIFKAKEDIVELNDLKEDFIVNEKIVTEEHKEKCRTILIHAIKRNWI